MLYAYAHSGKSRTEGHMQCEKKGFLASQIGSLVGKHPAVGFYIESLTVL